MHAFSMERVGLGGGVDPQPRHVRPAGEALRRRVDARPPARAAASAISDDVDAVSVMRPSNPSGRPRRLAQPVDDDLLELGGDRRRPPEHRVRAERRRQELAEHARHPTPSSRNRRRTPGAASGSRWARSSRDVGEDRLERLGPLGRRRREQRPKRARLDGRKARRTPRRARGSRRSGRRPGAPPPELVGRHVGEPVLLRLQEAFGRGRDHGSESTAPRLRVTYAS